MEGELSDLVKPFSWLIGSWESVSGEGKFPTIQDFAYNERIEFKASGKQPLLAYSGYSSHPVKGNPMHLEQGFLRFRAEKNISFMVAHNFGLTSIEEGTADGNLITLKSKSIGRMTGAAEPEVLAIERKFTLQKDDGTLIQELSMSTTKTPNMTHHLKAVYKRKA